MRHLGWIGGSINYVIYKDPFSTLIKSFYSPLLFNYSRTRFWSDPLTTPSGDLNGGKSTWSFVFNVSGTLLPTFDNVLLHKY